MKSALPIFLGLTLLLSACGRPLATPMESVFPSELNTPVSPGGSYPLPQEPSVPPESTPEVPLVQGSLTPYPPPQESPPPTPYPPPAETQPPEFTTTPTTPAGAPTQYPGPQDTLPPAPTQGTPPAAQTPLSTPTFNFETTTTAASPGAPALTATERPISTAMPPPGTIAQTIRIWHSWSGSEVQVLDFVLQTFQDFYPNVAFDVLYVPQDELLNYYEMAAYRGEGPSLLFGPAEWGPALYAKGLISDLSNDAAPYFLAEINPAALGNVLYRGALLGLPYRIRDGVLLYRNAALLPEPVNSFEELVQKAQAITRGGNVGAYLERGFLFSGGHLIGLGGRLMDDQGLPAFNTPQGIAWIKLLQSFEQAGATDFNSNRDLDLFKEGRIGWVIDGSWSREELAKAIGEENLAIDPWPSSDGGRLSGFVRSDNIYLNANLSGDQRYAALLFMGYMMAREVQSILARAGHIPSVRGVEVRDPLIRQAMEAFSGGAPYPIDPAFRSYWDPLEAALRTIFEEDADPQVALQLAYDQILEKLK